MDNTKASLLVVAALAVGATFGYFIHGTAETSQEADDDEGFTRFVKAAELAELRDRSEALAAENDRLRKMLAKRTKAPEASEVEEELVVGAQPTDEGAGKDVFGNAGSKKLTETLGKLMKNVTVESPGDKSVAILTEISTEWMSADELAVHNKLIDLIQQKSELDRKMVESIFAIMIQF